MTGAGYAWTGNGKQSKSVGFTHYFSLALLHKSGIVGYGRWVGLSPVNHANLF